MSELLLRARDLGVQLGRLALDAVLPPRCLRCDAAVAGPHQLCSRCWNGIRFITEPLCSCCGTPFAYETQVGLLCAACIAEPPRFRKARSVMVYDEVSRDAVLSFKHADRTDAAPAFGAWLARAGAELLREADALLPVPLHRWRLFRRRYNQSALLAHAVARLAGLPVLASALQRVRNTPTQGKRSRSARIANVRGAFRVRPQCRTLIADRRILVIDDVMTTGATVEACAAALLNAGAHHVDVLTLARVVRSPLT